MKKRRGFTLIELLAVIVILAVISFISIPIVINIVNKAKKSAFLDSAYGIIESAKLYYAESMLNGGMMEDKTFLFEGDIPEGLHYSGTSPKEGILIIKKDGSISFAFHNGNYCTSKEEKDNQITISSYDKENCVILDTTKNPVITLKGEKEVSLFIGDTYTEEGVEAKTVDGTELTYMTEIKLNDTIVESIDTSSVNTYIITYTTESNRKKASETRKVIIKEECWVIADINNHGNVGNTPELNGLVPIKYQSKEDQTTKWYDYDNQMWANAASVTKEYRNAEIGTVIPESAVLAYFVWIPRYEYMYTNLGDSYAGGTKSQPGEIKVNFIEKNVTTASSSDYKINPAFHFGGTAISGVWVGKFETSAEEGSRCFKGPSEGNCDNKNQIPRIKPNVNSLRHQKVSNQFATAKKFSSSGNIYGISVSADAHMMKNSEWGAVAYLSQSKYGKYGNNNYTGTNKEIYINNYWDDNNPLTGCSAGTPKTGSRTSCAYTYEKKEGTGASTTGTIYGVYDMNGGLQEYVMGVYRGSGAASTWGASSENKSAGFSSAPAAKYYDEYKTINAETACNNSICYGHALSETHGWYFDFAGFVNSDRPWILRGGLYSYTTTAGVFYFDQYYGTASSNFSFRVALLGN